MDDITPLRFDLPAVARRKLTVDFDGGNQSSDAGVLLLRAAEQKIGVIGRMAAALPDRIAAVHKYVTRDAPSARMVVSNAEDSSGITVLAS